jgi:hypothetical protein
LPHNTQSQGTGPWPDLVVRGFAGCRFHLREGTSVSGGTLMGLAKFVFFWRYWSLNSGLHAWKTGALQLEGIGGEKRGGEGRGVLRGHRDLNKKDSGTHL